MAEGSSRRTGLTANAVKNAKPKEKPYKLSDRDGLYLLIKPTGVRYWRMNYRFDGQQRQIHSTSSPLCKGKDAGDPIRILRIADA
jgi:hypothetical protein